MLDIRGKTVSRVPCTQFGFVNNIRETVDEQE